MHDEGRRDMRRRNGQTTNASPALDRVAKFSRSQLIGAIDEMLGHFNQPRARGPRSRGSGEAERIALALEHQRLCSIAELLMEWHSNDAYLTPDGSPRPLPASGKRSLITLARRVTDSPARARQLASDLLAFDLVHRGDKLYLPAQRSAVLGKANPLNLAYATIAVTRLLQTISHNVANRFPRLYERQVSDATIAVKDLPIFLRFVEQQAQYAIDSTDDWLARRKFQKKSAKGSVRVGFGAFAWADLAHQVLKSLPRV